MRALLLFLNSCRALMIYTLGMLTSPPASCLTSNTAALPQSMRFLREVYCFMNEALLAKSFCDYKVMRVKRLFTPPLSTARGARAGLAACRRRRLIEVR